MDCKILKYPIFSELDGIVHGASTRMGGVSGGYFSSMNLGLGTDDDISNVRKNWEIFCSAAGIDINKTVCAAQTHTDNIRYVTEKDCGKGIVTARDYNDVDALVTNEHGIALCVFSADCIPVLFADVKEGAIGAAHCGWRGTCKELAAKTVFEMQKLFGCRPENIKAAVGAGIHKCCYEVDEKLYSDFKEKFGGAADAFSVRDGRFYLDLPEINRYVLLSAGLAPENIYVSDLCTCCNKDTLFSHRGSHGKRGLMVNFIQM